MRRDCAVVFGLEGRGEGERDHASEISDGVRGVREPLEGWEEESVDRDGGGGGGRGLLSGR